MSSDIFTSIPATIGGGFMEGLLLGYTLKKVVKLIAVVVGSFIAGLAYLQYQQIAYFDWDKIERMVTDIFGNIGSQISGQDITSYALSNLGIPLTSFELYRRIREKDKKPKVCFTTSFLDYYESLKENYPEIDSTCLIAKPIAIEHLIKRIKAELSER